MHSISERALLKRINQHLASEGQRVRRFRCDARDWELRGEYCLCDTSRNSLLAKAIDLEAFGRELGVISECEGVASC
ncbi:MAG TPA: hypothetical protein VJL61_06720 [Rhodanobacteraceae bacterium]|nr:hypothetical protein [Rhodanobacteraceae bacterium]